MVKARNLYIYVGNDNITILRGYDMERYEGEKGIFYKGKIKHRGVFTSYFPVVGLKDYLLGEPKGLFIKNKIIPGWKAQIVKMDFVSHEEYTPDVPARLTSEINNLRTEVQRWKRRCFEAETKLITMEGEDRFTEKIKEKLKFASEARNLSSAFSGYDGMGGMGGYGGGYGSFGSRFLGGLGTQTQPKTE